MKNTCAWKVRRSWNDGTDEIGACGVVLLGYCEMGSEREEKRAL